MRVAQNDIYIDERGRRYRRMSLEQRGRLRKDYMAHVPRWRYPLIGYIISIPATAAVLLCNTYATKIFGQFLFPSTFCMLSILLVALFWGVGPAILAVVLNSAALYYFTVLPFDQTEVQTWRDALQLLPFMIAGLIIAVITAQRERARLQAMATEQEIQLYAQELEEINKRLEDANQMKDRFLSIASHELKTPITTIRGQAQLMLRRISKQKKPHGELDGVTGALERINDQTSRLTALIDDLLDVSSMRAGKAVLNKRMCDMYTLFRQVIEDQQLLTDRQITLEAAGETCSVLLDPDRITQVITNLVSNALKYSPDKSPVEVSVKPIPGHIHMEVRDHGRGIAKDQQEHIFETFYRTPEAQSSTKRGLGLGLAISKDIVERHGGRIWCESEANKGSTFFVELPLEIL